MCVTAFIIYVCISKADIKKVLHPFKGYFPNHFWTQNIILLPMYH